MLFVQGQAPGGGYLDVCTACARNDRRWDQQRDVRLSSLYPLSHVIRAVDLGTRYAHCSDSVAVLSDMRRVIFQHARFHSPGPRYKRPALVARDLVQ